MDCDNGIYNRGLNVKLVLKKCKGSIKIVKYEDYDGKMCMYGEKTTQVF